MEQELGVDHPNTLRTRSALANLYQLAGQTDEAIRLGERVATTMEQVLGFQHPNTIRTRRVLAYSYQSAGRTEEAIDLLKQVIFQMRRLGVGNPDVATETRTLEAWLSTG